MNCPNDNTTLVMSDRNGIEIDYCPTCRGVWLDRGELDKIIERSSNYQQATPQQAQHYGQPAPDKTPSQDAQTPHHYHKKKKRESFFEDLFDF